jgi:hypothetical protein
MLIVDKCIWCGKNGEGYKELTLKSENLGENKMLVCSDECEKKTTSYYQKVSRNLKFFVTGILLSVFIGIPLTFMPKIGLSIMCGGVALTVILFPFTTPQTNALLGIKKSTLLTRIIGLIMLAIVLFFNFR